MIQPSELRIGNLVKVNFTLNPEREKVARIEWVDFQIIGESEDNSSYTPIPLTEEWLMKAVFVKEFTGYQEDNVMRAHIEKNLFIEYDLNHMALSIHQDTDIIGVDHIQYLHQLQNLYFALTGEELNIEI